MTSTQDEREKLEDSWSLGIILKHGLGDYTLKNKNESNFVDLPFNVEEACREMDIERDKLTAALRDVLGHLNNHAISANECLCLIRRDIENALIDMRNVK